MLIPTLFLAFGVSYYINPSGGDDGALGTSPRSAWRSLAPVVARAHFAPGDRLLLAGGGKITGPLALKGPMGLTVTSYGKGRATIAGGAGDGIVVQDGKTVQIQNLNLTADGRNANDGRGIYLVRSKDVRLLGIEVSGFRVSGVEVLGSERVAIEKVIAHDNGSAGFSVAGGYADFPRSKDVILRDCRALNNPGDPKNLTNHSGNGIVVGGVDGCLIEYCEAANNGWDMPREGNGPVGIWAWNASRVTIQHSISHDNKSPGTDGGGFDLDGGVTDSTIQSNLSYGNAGAGYLLCQYEGAGAWRDNIVQNNVSFEDGLKNFHSGIALYLPAGMTNMKNARVERNTIINSGHAISTMGDIPGLTYRHNVFVSGGEMLNVAWGAGGFGKAEFRNNLAWSGGEAPSFLGKHSPFSTAAAWSTSGGQYAEPRLRLPQSTAELPTDPRALDRLVWFAPYGGSPTLWEGKVVRGASLRKGAR